jgi:hypothetical protein
MPLIIESGTLVKVDTTGYYCSATPKPGNILRLGEAALIASGTIGTIVGSTRHIKKNIIKYFVLIDNTRRLMSKEQFKVI